MSKSALLLVASMALAVAAAGCGTVTVNTGTNSSNANANAPKPAAPATNTPPASTPAAAPAGDQLSNLAVHNKSKWAVHHLFLSPANQNEWGPDQLGENTIEPGATFTLKGIPCNTYDIKVVDEDGDECMVKGEKFCGHEVSWDLTDDELLGCEGYGEK